MFDSRFCHARELMRFGADIDICGRDASVWGVRSLKPATVTATDLRGGASMIIAAMCAEGESVIVDGGHIIRGYEKLDRRLGELGADIVFET